MAATYRSFKTRVEAWNAAHKDWVVTGVNGKWYSSEGGAVTNLGITKTALAKIPTGSWGEYLGKQYFVDGREKR